MEWYPAAQADDIAAGQGIRVEVDGSALGIFHLEGRFYAIQDFCPHRGGSLGLGEMDEDGWVACPLHAWFFNVKTGDCATSELMKIKTFDCKVEEGRVWVQLPQERHLP